MNDPIVQDFVLQDHQRRVDESLRAYKLFKADRAFEDDEPKARLAGRWIDIKGMLRLCWSVGYGFALNRP